MCGNLVSLCPVLNTPMQLCVNPRSLIGQQEEENGTSLCASPAQKVTESAF